MQLRTIRTRLHKLTMDLFSSAGELYDLQEIRARWDYRFNDAALATTQRELKDMIASRPMDACAPLPHVGMA